MHDESVRGDSPQGCPLHPLYLLITLSLLIPLSRAKNLCCEEAPA